MKPCCASKTQADSNFFNDSKAVGMKLGTHLRNIIIFSAAIAAVCLNNILHAKFVADNWMKPYYACNLKLTSQTSSTTDPAIGTTQF